MELVTHIKDIAQRLNLAFVYAPASYANLLKDIPADKWYLMLDPIKAAKSISSKEWDDNYTYHGTCMLLTKSEMDSGVSYENRHEAYFAMWQSTITPALDNLIKQVYNEIQSGNHFDITKFNHSDVFNLFDENLSGKIIEFTIKKI